MKNKKGFTLVELLAVIVILGIILLIAVPKITSTISNATEASMIASAKMLAASVEREDAVRSTLGNATAITCADVATLSSVDYDLATCAVKMTAGVATVNLAGKAGGKFAGKYVCGATRLTGTVTTAGACAAL